MTLIGENVENIDSTVDRHDIAIELTKDKLENIILVKASE